MSFKPTQEQDKIVEKQGEGMTFKVEAVAGSGKTSTVKLMGEATDNHCLYLAFNKSAAEEGKRKMPFNVTCRTTHSIAYQEIITRGPDGEKLKEKLSRPTSGKYVNVAGTVKEIALMFRVGDIDFIKKNAIARCAKQTVANFESSAATEIEKCHIPKTDLQKWEQTAKAQNHGYSESLVVRKVIEVAQALWEKRIDPNSPVLMSHDTYMKLYQLSHPQLDYDTIFLDEAQDTSDCVIDIVSRQNAQVVCVGDTFQSIYGWRGAVNALAKIEAPSLSLSQSFRYGPRVASVARYILNDAMEVRGLDEIDTKVGQVDTSKPYTQLFRTNLAIIKRGVQLIRDGVAVEIDADIAGFIRKIKAMEDLRWGNKVTHEDIVIFQEEEWRGKEKVYSGWDNLIEEAEACGGELKLLVKLILSDNFPEIKGVLNNYVKPKKARVTLTTAHKSKGMEYDQVILADDFPDVIDEETGEFVELNDMERNLLYVAATRATMCLQVNQTVMDIIAYRNMEGMQFDVFEEGEGPQSGLTTHIQEEFDETIEAEMLGIDSSIRF